MKPQQMAALKQQFTNAIQSNGQQMQQPNMQQTTLGINPRTNTNVPQTAQAPNQVNAMKVDNQNRGLQQQGVAPAQAMNKAATNPNNTYAKGGDVSPPTPDQIRAELQTTPPDSSSVNAIADDSTIKNAIKEKPASSSDQMENMFKQYDTPEGKKYLEDRAKSQHYAKGGDVHASIKNMSLKDVIKLLASHPELGGMGAGNAGSPTQGQDMRAGGAVAGQNDPDANMQGKAELRAHGNGLLSMNRDVQGYATGGGVDGGSQVVDNNNSGIAAQNVGMATGGSPQEEADSVVSYGPDGTPIIQNPDGTQQYGDINQELGRPEGAPTLGTGEQPTNATTSNVANSVGQQQPSGPAQTVTGNAMAKGGEEAGPPGALSKEVADDIPAALSEGEFVFSADATRFWGLKTLTEMQDHAREQLAGMQNDGKIRSPGDGKNEDEAGQFMQDKEPDMDAYNDEDEKAEGLLKECMGGGTYSEGGPVAEEQFSKGGAVDHGPYGRDNMTSSHPTQGTPLLDYARGGIVSPTSSSLTPKKFSSDIPEGKMRLSTPGVPKGPRAQAYGIKKLTPPKVKKGGLLNRNQERDVQQEQSYIGS